MLRRLLDSEAAGGIILIVAAAAAIIVANSALGDFYRHALHAQIGPTLSENLGPMTPHLWINDGLMAVFFLLVGLEIKREMADGRLSTWEQRRLPALPALLGMAFPAMIYLAFAGSSPALAGGWAIPAATDIAFAMGVLALLGRRAPLSLKLFLVTVAILDDLGAVLIIAVFYTSSLNVIAMAAAASILIAMWGMNRLGLRHLGFYVVAAALLWYATLLSGVHATVAGVLAALMIPISGSPGAPDSAESPLHRLEHALTPWVAFLIVPIFGFANAGVDLAGSSLATLLAPLPLGIAAGLFFGKQIGVFGGVLLAVKTGLAAKPRGATWLQIYAVCLLCGIGFTMSLFIGGLAFPDNPELVEEAKAGILAGSLLSAIVGCAILRFARPADDALLVEAAQQGEIRADGDVARL